MFNVQNFDFNFPLVIAAAMACFILRAFFRRDSLWCLLPALIPMGYYIYKTVYPFAPITPMTPIITAKIVWGFANAAMLFPIYVGFCGIGFLLGRAVRQAISRFRGKAL